MLFPLDRLDFLYDRYSTVTAISYRPALDPFRIAQDDLPGKLIAGREALAARPSPGRCRVGRTALA